jgi:hypothetical protein
MPRTLRLVALQLRLPGMESGPDSYRLNPDCVDARLSTEKDSRTGDQLLRSVVAYLDWRAGDSWRRLGTHAGRFSPSRLEYLEAIYLINTVRSTYAPPCNCHRCTEQYGWRTNHIGPEPPSIKAARLAAKQTKVKTVKVAATERRRA